MVEKLEGCPGAERSVVVCLEQPENSFNPAGQVAESEPLLSLKVYEEGSEEKVRECLRGLLNE